MGVSKVCASQDKQFNYNDDSWHCVEIVVFVFFSTSQQVVKILKYTLVVFLLRVTYCLLLLNAADG